MALRSPPPASQLVKQNGGLTYIEEDIMLGLVRDIASEMLADAAVPVGAVLGVEELLDELGDTLLVRELIEGLVDLVLDLGLHFVVHLADDPLHITFSHISNFIILNYILN